jgi:glycine/D-amino acid oxidase-like deaminating enzyme
MPGYGRQYWAERTAENRRRVHGALRGELTADVVVIGGGLTGCAAAAGLVTAGFDVILVEADRLASGATAGALGAILPEPDARFASVERVVGRRLARTAWKEAHRSALEFASVLRRLPIRTDLASADLVINTIGSSDVALLQREQAARKDAGLDAAWMSADAARDALATESRGAMRLRSAFMFDPVRAALGLAGLAESKGARIFERSPVVRTKFTRKDATVVLSGGAIRTRRVFVATGEPGRLFGQLRRHVRRHEGFAVATASLPAAVARSVGSHASVFTESGGDPHWLRWLSDDRLLFAGAAAKPVGERQLPKILIQRTAQLMYELSVRYPAISGLPAAWGWNVPIIRTLDGLPWIGPHRNYPHHYFALALGWHGDGLAWFAARAAARLFRDEARREDEAFGFLRMGPR